MQVDLAMNANCEGNMKGGGNEKPSREGLVSHSEAKCQKAIGPEAN